MPFGNQEAGLAMESLELGLAHTSLGALPRAGRWIEHTVGLGFVAEVKENALEWMGWPQTRTSSSTGQDLGRGAPEGREGEASKEKKQRCPEGDGARAHCGQRGTHTADCAERT